MKASIQEMRETIALHRAYGHQLVPTRGKVAAVPWKEPVAPSVVDHLCLVCGLNVGIVCGRSGIVVADADSPSALELLRRRFPQTPWRQRTPRGLEHWFYQSPAEALGPRVKVNGIALDIRAGMSYVVASPSFSEERQAAWELLGDVLPAKDLPVFPMELVETRLKLKPKTFVIDDVFERIARARAYLAKVDPAISGANGHNKTLYAACVLVQRFGLTIEQSWPLFLEYNARCQPPWDEKNLLRKLHEAQRLKQSIR